MKAWLVMIAVVLVGALAAVFGGAFNAAADDPHWRATHRVLEVVRERSIAMRARQIDPPPLDDPDLLAGGAEHYAAMCVGCHLAPGVETTELRSGLYPQPPDLTVHAAYRSPAETFWIIKHGLKMTGMPAWGVTHDDRSIWGLVAFLETLPELSEEEFVTLATAAGKEEHSHTHGTDRASPGPTDKPDASSDPSHHSHAGGAAAAPKSSAAVSASADTVQGAGTPNPISNSDSEDHGEHRH